MIYSTIIFDFDYTLADATDGIVSSFNHAFSGLEIPGCDSESRDFLLFSGLHIFSINHAK
ncbi:HAD hydrolase-like protein, partial [Methanosarcina sp.]|uniref:HAD hydrolase-like protein n=1 Tax=Methanosarcina sp. TaxID=2213 RepID=UPI003A0FE8E6